MNKKLLVIGLIVVFSSCILSYYPFFEDVDVSEKKIPYYKSNNYPTQNDRLATSIYFNCQYSDNIWNGTQFEDKPICETAGNITISLLVILLSGLVVTTMSLIIKNDIQ